MIANRAVARPAIPQGATELTPGQVPTICAAGANANSDGPTFGYYYLESGQNWVSAPCCYPRWGYLEASPSKVVAAGDKITIVAIPKDGSNSGQYAPETKTITWKYPGVRIAGCGPSDLSCTVIPSESAGAEWQWLEFEVTMPRTFFIDSPGSNCAGQHTAWCGNACMGIRRRATPRKQRLASPPFLMAWTTAAEAKAAPRSHMAAVIVARICSARDSDRGARVFRRAGLRIMTH